jgi:hypothetical protein
LRWTHRRRTQECGDDEIDHAASTYTPVYIPELVDPAFIRRRVPEHQEHARAALHPRRHPERTDDRTLRFN